MHMDGCAVLLADVVQMLCACVFCHNVALCNNTEKYIRENSYVRYLFFSVTWDREIYPTLGMTEQTLTITYYGRFHDAVLRVHYTKVKTRIQHFPSI